MVRRAACGPPDFPTCGFGDATAPDQDDVVHAQIVKLGDGGVQQVYEVHVSDDEKAKIKAAADATKELVGLIEG